MNSSDKDLLRQIADLCAIASETIFEDEKTAEILNACDNLVDLIDRRV